MKKDMKKMPVHAKHRFAASTEIALKLITSVAACAAIFACASTAAHAVEADASAVQASTPASTVASANNQQLSHGEYLTKAADCIACHTANKDHPYAGGVPFATPFGIVYSTNISPDRDHGIGSFTDKEFISAVREGVSKDGKRLYPTMPYTSYTQLSDDDILAIRDYLKTVKPIATDPPKNTLPFPFNQRWAMMFWNMVNFTSGRFAPDASKSAEWNRGAYLVGALGHCQECHTPRNVTMGLSNKPLAGAPLGNWTAFNITPDNADGIGSWTNADIVDYLRDGAAPGKANAAGPMAEVVENSTRFLSAADLQAMAVYLRSVPAQSSGSTQSRFSYGTPLHNVTDIRGKMPAIPDAESAPGNGKTLYVANCASCHSWNGQGIGGNAPGAYPALIHNSVLGTADANNLTMVILHGVSRETNHGHVVMPAFSGILSDTEIATLVNYTKSQFGNPGTPITAQQVQKLR